MQTKKKRTVSAMPPKMSSIVKDLINSFEPLKTSIKISIISSIPSKINTRLVPLNVIKKEPLK